MRRKTYTKQIAQKVKKALLEVGQEFASHSSEIKSVMKIVRARCAKLFDCERCSLFVVDEESQALCGLSAEDDATETSFPLRAGLTGKVANSGEKINLQARRDGRRSIRMHWSACSLSHRALSPSSLLLLRLMGPSLSAAPGALLLGEGGSGWRELK